MGPGWRQLVFECHQAVAAEFPDCERAAQGRPPGSDAEACKQRNAVDRCINRLGPRAGR
ncbi:hypothetical protein GCM10010345_18220 [Streptomyces canarius]|uniref:Uncharacterized protein n=1 Tax=Streptomyces canarius TaxID=285453 RepID=A0ABQ3CLE0_9ACTN|nr:hypothetical protein GCM10010345_18220 [Streptomyces canarius]